MTPDATRIETAMQRSEPLVRMRRLLLESEARFAAIRGELPALMTGEVAPGPVDEAGWSLLAANASVAAKLRQLQPHLEQVLREQGWDVCAIRIRVAKQ